MPDHDLGLMRAAGGAFAGFSELPVAHLAEPALGFVGVLGSRRRAAAGRLHIGLGHVEFAVTEFGHRMNIGVIVDADAGGDFRHLGVRSELEFCGHRRRVLVDDQRNAQHLPDIAGQ